MSEARGEIRSRSVDRRVLLAAVILSAVVGAGVGAVVGGLLDNQPASGTQRIVTTTGGSGIAVGDLAQQRAASVVTILVRPADAAGIASDPSAVVDGVLVSSDGLVLTSSAAVKGATTLRVATADGHAYDATVAASDVAHGVAVLRVEGGSGFSTSSLASSSPKPGDVAVMVARNPAAGALQVGVGTIRGPAAGTSLLLGSVVDINTDPGDAGAPVFDAVGRLLGVAVTGSGTSSSLLLTSPVAAQDLITAAHSNGPPATDLGITYTLIGADLAALAGAKPGALVVAVRPGSPAEAAGLKPGDVVTAVNGTPVDGGHPPDALILGAGTGSSLALTVWRGGASRTLTLAVPGH